ncbi:hypothetical protein D3Z58_23780 [Clostridiaceae bacterium]|nr:hypothetical protein [Clostridiaceae bacterium]
MKEIIETILENIQYIYPGYIVLFVYQYITGNNDEETERFFLKIVSISYIMIKIIWSLCDAFFDRIAFQDGNILTLAKHTTLVMVSVLLPILFYRIRKTNLIKKFFKWNKIPIDTSANLVELMEKKCPRNCIVYITLYMESHVYAGVLANAEIGEKGFFGLKYWIKYNLNRESGIIESASERIYDEGMAIIPQQSIIHFHYEYLNNSVSLPAKII